MNNFLTRVQEHPVLIVGYINCRGQTGFTISKQLQIEIFLQSNNIDVLHLQETRIQDDTFSGCHFIASNYTVIKNNSHNQYGTASLVRNCFFPEDIILHHSGRVILFNIGNITLGNVYLPSGTDGQSRTSRENFCGETLPTLLINAKSSGLIGGDWNNIINHADSTNHPEAKMSPCLKRVVSTFSWTDTYRMLYPNNQCFSHFYSNTRYGNGATRLDRSYSFGNLIPTEAKYIGVAFSDHLSYIVSLSLPCQLQLLLSPKTRPFFKTTPAVIKDKVFQTRLADSMQEWEAVRAFGVPTLTWWEILVKPGIKKLAIERSKELKKERKNYLNLLMMRQTYLVKKMQGGNRGLLPALKEVQIRIEDWFSTEVERVKYQAKVEDIQGSEKVRIYHHELHQKSFKRSYIMKLQTEQGLLEGHIACSQYLQEKVEELLLHPAELDQAAQDLLLDEVSEEFTEDDNTMLDAIPTKAEVEESVKTSNGNAAPGCDGITSLFYKECFHIVGDALTDVAKEIFAGHLPTKSQRTSLMLFTNKPGKSQSLKPRDKRRISLLNSDFKVFTGMELNRYNKVVTHTLCPQQLAAGDHRRITFGISLARDAIYAAGKKRQGCALQDNDFEAAFDFLCLDWVKLVLKKKGVSEVSLARFSNLYDQGITIPVINNVPGKPVSNIRLSLRQGDRPSGVWFCFGIDPLLIYLERRLTGILIHSLPVQGPAQNGQVLPPHETRYRVQGYLDDCKPAITSMAEFQLVDTACSLFEKSSGCKLHRDPTTEKCKVLMIGRWKDLVQQEDIPLPYLKVTDHLDFLGCKLYSDYGTSRRENGEILKSKIRKQMASWKSGKFLPLTSRPWSLNCYSFSKLWYRSSCLDLRVGDSNSITSMAKGWLYQDMLVKPQEIMLFRSPNTGGLGLYNVRSRAMAMLIQNFLLQAVSPNFPTNFYLNSLFRWHVLEERHIADPGRPPYYSEEFFKIIKDTHFNSPLNVAWITLKQWYQILIERGVTHTTEAQDSPPILLPSHLEEKYPDINFPHNYGMCRLFGLSPEQKSFLFKMRQNLLPTRERLHRLGKIPSPSCRFCNHEQDTTEHLLSCPISSEVVTPLVSCLSSQTNNLTNEDIILSSIHTSESWELPAMWLTSTCLSLLWEDRVKGISTSIGRLRAELLAKVALLRDTKWKHFTLHNSALLLDEAINLHFN